jgi:hypothetical protein
MTNKTNLFQTQRTNSTIYIQVPETLRTLTSACIAVMYHGLHWSLFTIADFTEPLPPAPSPLQSTPQSSPFSIPFLSSNQPLSILTARQEELEKRETGTWGAGGGGGYPNKPICSAIGELQGEMEKRRTTREMRQNGLAAEDAVTVHSDFTLLIVVINANATTRVVTGRMETSCPC